jgi:hypothetical protein
MKLFKKALLLMTIPALYIGLNAADRSSGNGQDKGKEDNVIGYLHTRDKIITIVRGPNGTVYTIKTKSGKTLATKARERDLQAKFPDVYRQVKDGLAGNDATLRRLQ